MIDNKQTNEKLVGELAQLQQKIATLENKLKKTEQTLLDSENKYYSLLNTAPVGIMITDSQGSILELNERFAALYGCDRAEMIGKNYFEVIRNPETRLKAEELFKRIRDGEDVSSQEISIQSKEGNGVPVELEASALRNEAGKITHFIAKIRDLSEEKKRQEELQRSKDKYQSLVENLNDIVFTLDIEGNFAYMSPAIENISSYRAEELIGKHFAFFVHPDDLPQLGKSFEKTLAGKLESSEFRAMDKDGKGIFVRTSSRPLFEQGKLVGLNGVMTDITKYKTIEEDLSKFKFGIERSGDAIFTTDIEGKILYVNPAFEKIYGFTKEEALGKTPRILKSGLLAPEVYKKFWDTLLGKNTLAGELVNKTKDGRLLIVEGSANPILNEKEEIVGFLAIQRDITDRKRTEEALVNERNLFKTFMDHTPDAIFFKDTNGNYTKVNKTFASLAGVENPEKMAGKTDSDFMFKEYVQEFREEDEKIIASGKPIIGKVGHITRHDNEEYWHLRSKVPIFDKDGAVIGIFCTLQDITFLKIMEEELVNAKKLESLGILAGGIAHDFNNILATILGNISLAKLKIRPDDRNFERLTKAENGCIRARDLTQQLLTFSRGGTPVKNPINITELLKDSINFFLRGAKIKCNSSIPDELWPVEVDEGQIHQVINNLILNADQAMPEGGAIDIKAENFFVEAKHGLPIKQGKYVRITIQDYGVGIPKENLSRIFDPYFTTKQKGTGLGLTTAYAVLKRHEGHIAVQSKEGMGTTTYVYLPASDKKPSVMKQKKEQLVRGKGRILVMDDENEIRDTLFSMLAELGYEAQGARDGNEAVNMYRQAKDEGIPFAVVIMDLMIPGGLGGKEAMAKLQTIDPSVKVIVSSGYSNDPVMADYKSYGFKEMIPKPFRMEKLSEVVNNLINL